MNLNIIGNGFDLFHGLPSSYFYFACYLIDNDPDFYEEIGRMYNVTVAEIVGPSIAHEYVYTAEDIFWSNFENHLGEVDEYAIVDTHENDLGLENPDPIEIDMDFHKLADKMKRSFVRWVVETLDVKGNYDLIKSRFASEGCFIDISNDDIFINFNYTHTLQEVYGIDSNKIHYIHGECLGDEDDDLIVGHGNHSRIEEVKDHLVELNANYDYTQGSQNNINEYECLLSYLRTLKKDVDYCERDCKRYLHHISDKIKKIQVFGLSMGSVDLPYLVKLVDLYPDAVWEFSYYNDKSIEKVKYIAENELGLIEDKYKLFKLNNPISDEIKEKIIEELGINEYVSPNTEETNSIA